MPVCDQKNFVRKDSQLIYAVIAGFFTGGSLAIRGGRKAALTSGIGCAVLLGVIEGVGIGFQRMMAGNTALSNPLPPAPPSGGTGTVAAVA